METKDRTRREADEQAVLDHLTRGVPIDPETYQRVRERAKQITERLRRQHGELDVAVSLIREIREE